jgi:hypothetical protein
VTDAEALWKWGVVERWAPALGGWLRTDEHVTIRPGETPEAVARRLEMDPLRWLGTARPVLRVVVVDIQA